MVGIGNEFVVEDQHQRDQVVLEIGADGETILDLTGRSRVPAPTLQQIHRRPFDVVIAGAMLIGALPIMCAVALAVALTSKGPVLYRSERLGMGGTRFDMWKFRTMAQNASELLEEFLDDPAYAQEYAAGFKLKNDPRMTKIGRHLRRYNLDELPQIFNIIRGEMSVVGPRPKLPEEALRFGPEIGRVLSVKPGLTGPWQISGRNDLSFEKRIELDLAYVNDNTLIHDCGIVVRTAAQTLSGRSAGAY